MSTYAESKKNGRVRKINKYHKFFKINVYLQITSPKWKILELRQKPNVKSGDYGNLGLICVFLHYSLSEDNNFSFTCHSLE